MQKKYERPTLKPLGSVRELTLGASSGKHLDQDYTAGTDSSALTFS